MTRTEGLDQSPPVELGPLREDPVSLVDLRALFREHAIYVWNTLRRLGAPPSDLEDLTHDVFLQVHKHRADFEPTRPIRPWLFGFAYRIASQSRRRAFRRREVPGEPDASAHPGARPDEALARARDQALVIDALQALPPDRRAVFILYEIDETPMDEVARSLGIPVNTAYSRLRVARREFAGAVRRLRGRGRST